MNALTKRQRALAMGCIFVIFMATHNPLMGFAMGLTFWYLAEAIIEERDIRFRYGRDAKMLARLLLVLFFAVLAFIEALSPLTALGFALWPLWYITAPIRAREP